MINLLPTSAVADANLARLKYWVTTFTTVVLVGYVLVLVGLAGRSWYLAERTTTVSAQIATLTSQMGQLAEMEAVLRQQDDRLKSIRQTLAGRVDLAQTASTLAAANVTVTDWEYMEQLPPVQNVVAVGSSAANLEAYATNLRYKFATDDIKTLSLRLDGQWQIKLQLTGGKP